MTVNKHQLSDQLTPELKAGLNTASSLKMSTIKVRLYSAKDDQHVAVAEVPVDGTTNIISKLFKPNRDDYPGKVIADTIWIKQDLSAIEVTVFDGGHPIQIKKDGEPQRIAGDNQDLADYSICARKTG